MTRFIRASELAAFLVDKFYTFEGHYQANYDSLLRAHSIKKRPIRFNVELSDCTRNARSLEDERNPGRYIITIPLGFLIRIAINVYALNIDLGNRQPWPRGMRSIFSCEWMHRVPGGLNFADHGDHDRHRFPDKFEIIFFDCRDRELFWREMEKHWSSEFSYDIALREEAYFPFFWALDFIIYHEMAHIILGHIEYAKLDRDGYNDDALYLEGAADYLAAKMLVNSIPPINSYLRTGHGIGKVMLHGRDIGLVNENLRTLGFCCRSLFILMGVARESIYNLKNCGYPHADFRWRLFLEAIGHLFIENNKDRSIMVKAFVDAEADVETAYAGLGVHGVCRHVFERLGVPEREQEFLDYAEEEYRKYEIGVYGAAERISSFMNSDTRGIG
jgi:hypothetical protein